MTPKDPATPQPTQPVDVVDGIPDRSSRPARWKYLLIVIIFVAWAALLIYTQLMEASGE